jgi:hypothetical protein
MGKYRCQPNLRINYRKLVQQRSGSSLAQVSVEIRGLNNQVFLRGESSCGNPFKKISPPAYLYPTSCNKDSKAPYGHHGVVFFSQPLQTL